jgi:hypothetical protein
MMSEPVAALSRVSVPPLDIISYIQNFLIEVEVHTLHSPYNLSSLVLSSIRKNVIVIHFPDGTDAGVSFSGSLEAAGKSELNGSLLLNVQIVNKTT